MGVLDNLKVVDLSWGIAGPLTTMMLSDHGAEVIKVEPPGGDPFCTYPGYRVWNRGKKSMILDLKRREDQARLRFLAAGADILVESFRPGVCERLGIDPPRLQRDNPRLIYCSITGYGRHSRHRQRPAFDALVQARSGMQAEQPGVAREGPTFLYLPLPSYGACYLATLGISAALQAREITGLGQWVETSLMQGVLAFTTMLWSRLERPPDGFYDTLSKAAPSGLFECGDGRWLHAMWALHPVLAAALDEPPSGTGGRSAAGLAGRIAQARRDQESFRKKPRDEWLPILWQADLPAQPVLSTEEAFSDAQVRHNGLVVEVVDPEAGPMQQVGLTYTLHRTPGRVQGPAPTPGEHTEEVLASLASKESDTLPRTRLTDTGSGSSKPDAGLEASGPRTRRFALEGILVLDFGTRLAGPYAPMLLGDLGARVIKVEHVDGDPMRFADAPFLGCQRGKQGIAVDLKTPDGQAIAHRLAARADVVHHNSRPGVAERLRIDYASLQAVNPRLVYCHTPAYGSSGPRATWPGQDQLFQAMCGIEYEGGAMPAGGPPMWYRFGMCDTGNAFLSAIAVVQALYHRQRTGEGQMVETCLLNAGMFFNSDAFLAGAAVPRRPHLDKNQTGLGPLYRLYRAADGWLCLAAVCEEHWRSLCRALARPDLRTDERFATSRARAQHGGALASILEAWFAARTAVECFAQLDREGVPCEIAKEGYGQQIFDDPDAQASGWVAAYDHPTYGRVEQFGHLLALSATPTRIAGPPPLLGEHTQAILLELGYSDVEIQELRWNGVVTWP